MYTYSVTIKLKNSSCMNIVGVSKVDKPHLNIIVDEIYDAVMVAKDPEKAVAMFKKYGVNVWLDEVPYCTSTMKEVRDEILKKELTKFFDKGHDGVLEVASKCVLPITVI